jgi:hypothetical protein
MHPADKLSSAIDVYVRATNIGLLRAEERFLEKADVAILPRVQDLHWTAFDRATDLYSEGEKAARAKLDEIRKGLSFSRRWLPRRRPKTWKQRD